MSRPRPRFRLRSLMIAVAIVAVVLGLNWRGEVDIRTGRVRSGVYVFGLPVLRFTRDSVVTRALPAGRVASERSEWRRVVTTSLVTSISPHYVFHLAHYQIDSLGWCWEKADFTPEARRASAEAVIALWRKHDRYFEAGAYIDAVRMLARGADGRTIDVGDLPPSPR